MSYQARLLPPEEWPRLDQTMSGITWQRCDPGTTQIVVVEDGGRIVGVVGAVQIAHVHGLWIDEDYRHAPGVGRRLLRGVQRIADYWHANVVMTENLTGPMLSMVRKLGAIDGPGPTVLIPMSREEGMPCRQHS